VTLSSERPTAFVVEDAPLARQRLCQLLAEVGLVEVVGEAGDVDSAVTGIKATAPELVFLDVQLPGGSGFDVLEQVEPRPAVIFTTAFDEYAVTAFELAAVDYLLKPFGSDRLQVALERAIAALRDDRGGSGERAREILSGAPLRRIFVQQSGRIVPIPLAEVERFEARENYVLVHAGSRTHLLRAGLGELAARLDPAQFVRVHRSHIVNLDHVAAFAPFDSKRLVVEMKDGAHITASRAHSSRLRRLAD